ncbi:MAG: DUF1801 domain-containing protein [Bacteroidetes bacterium]|jgi:uncharacterized protein YdhG (YjbR/CyaY superfamily)|nr:DUF1801 domain-containing protein [Bacteroidota bacterium]
MQYEAKTPSEYLNKLDSDWRKEQLEQVRQIIKNQGPELIEGIEYKMLCYKRGGKSIFHLNAQRNYVSLYVGTINKVENAEELLSAFSTGKGCIRIKKSVNLPETGLEEFIKRTIALWERGGDTDC